MSTGRHRLAGGAGPRRQREMTERSQFGVDRLKPGAVEEQSQSGCRPGLKQGRLAKGIGGGGTKPMGREWRNEANWSSETACQRVCFTTSSVARGLRELIVSY
jgi:hypothetical protein